MASIKRLSNTDNGTTVDAQVGQPIELSLEENPSTGYSWQLPTTDDFVEVASDHVADVRPAGFVGSGGRRVVTLTPTRAGAIAFSAVYSRAWAPDPADQVFKITLAVSAGGVAASDDNAC